MDEIIHRMEHLPSDPREDNPLKITNDARKAGLDYRLIDPEAGDNPDSKINAAVERVYQIWRDTAGDRGTQLVFCDLSTPKGKVSASPAPQEKQEALNFEEEFVSGVDDPEDADNDSDLVESGDDNGEDTSVAADMDAVVALSSSKFSVYDDMRQKLMDKGIPADEIAFIHDAKPPFRTEASSST